MKYKADKWEIIISDNVIKILNSFIQDTTKKNESGGILLGKVYKENIINITDISIPNIFDKSTRYSFERDKKAAQIIVNHEFINSSGQCIYLGEWHTHPQINPQPSYQDKQMIKEQFKKNKLNEPFVILIVKGIKELYVALFNGNRLIIAEEQIC